MSLIEQGHLAVQPMVQHPCCGTVVPYSPSNQAIQTMNHSATKLATLHQSSSSPSQSTFPATASPVCTSLATTVSSVDPKRSSTCMVPMKVHALVS